MEVIHLHDTWQNCKDVSRAPRFRFTLSMLLTVKLTAENFTLFNNNLRFCFIQHKVTRNLLNRSNARFEIIWNNEDAMEEIETLFDIFLRASTKIKSLNCLSVSCYDSTVKQWLERIVVSVTVSYSRKDKRGVSHLNFKQRQKCSQDDCLEIFSSVPSCSYCCS